MEINMDDFLAYPMELKPAPESNSEMQTIAMFRRCLLIEDQQVMDSLLRRAIRHWPLQSLAEHMTPLEFMLLSMLSLAFFSDE
jgi:hypothetical protein